MKDVSVHISEAQDECAPVVEVKHDSITADIERLEDALGYPLESGMEINVTLQELLRIVPRKRPRKDSNLLFTVCEMPLVVLAQIISKKRAD